MRGAFWWVDRWQQSQSYKDMTLAEQGAFRNLCDELWLRDGVLPTEDRILAKICGDATEWANVKKTVMSRFYRTPEGWRNKTHDEVSASSKAFKERQAEKGRKRAEEAARRGGKFQPNIQPEHQPPNQPEVPAENQPSVLRTPFSVNGSQDLSTPTERARERAMVPGTSTALSVEQCAAQDRIDADLAFEEGRFNTLALPIRDSIQAVLDSLPRPASRSPFSASRWLRTGLTGIGRSESALTVLRLTNDALEARQRAQDAPMISDSNRQTMEASARVLARMKAQQAGQPMKEIEG